MNKYFAHRFFFCSFCGRHNDFIYKNRSAEKTNCFFGIIKMKFMSARREA